MAHTLAEIKFVLEALHQISVDDLFLCFDGHGYLPRSANGKAPNFVYEILYCMFPPPSMFHNQT